MAGFEGRFIRIVARTTYFCLITGKGTGVRWVAYDAVSSAGWRVRDSQLYQLLDIFVAPETEVGHSSHYALSSLFEMYVVTRGAGLIPNDRVCGFRRELFGNLAVASQTQIPGGSFQQIRLG